jgi:type IV secretion system protein VirB6
MPWGFYQNFSQQILEPISFLTQVAEALVAIVMPIIGAVLVIKVMLYGYEVLRGQVTQSVLLELAFRNLRPMMVISIALAGGAYAANIVPMVEELRTTLTSLFTQTHVTNSYAALDLSMDKALKAYEVMTEDAWENHFKLGVHETDLTGISMIACACLMLFSLLLYSVIAAAQLLAIDVMLKVLLATGPLFIAAFVFPATARFFDSWLTTVLKYVVTAALIMLAVGMGNGIFDDYTYKMQANAGLMDYMKAAAYSIAASGLLAYFTLKIPALAGDLLGGGGISVFSPASAVAPVASAFNSVSKPVREAVGGFVGGKGAAAATVMKQLVSRAIQPSGAGSISGAGNISSQAHFPRSRGARPAGQSMQSMLEKGSGK